MIESRWNADLLAKIFGVVFLAVGIAGFIPNPVVSASGFFLTNDPHNYVHVGTGVAFLLGAFIGAPVTTIRLIAIVYAVAAIVGFAFLDAEVVKYFDLNIADRWLHAFLAIGLLLVGFLAPMEERLSHARM